jgi:hypothetical protein
VTLGEKVGPVRVIRTTWGSDSGTNTIRTEFFYPDEIVQDTYLRVHPIPPLGGIFSYWDHTAGVITKYYNPEQNDGVPVDGVDDEVLGNGYVALRQGGVELRDNDPVLKNNPIEINPQASCAEECTDFDVTDPTLNATGTLAWEEVAGDHGSMVFRTRLNTAPDHLSPGDAQGVISIPYYRDDACFDDGTGIDPGPANTDPAQNMNPKQPCWKPNTPAPEGGWRQGLFGAHGVQVLMTPETDNVGPVGTVPIDEVDAETRMVVLAGNAGNVGESYGHAADVPLVATVIPSAAAAPTPGPGVDTTTITIDGDTSGVIGTPAHLSATLSDRLGPVSGQTLHFTFQGMVYDGTTDSNGKATVTVPVNEPAGSNTVVVDYDGDGLLRPPADAQGTFVAKRASTVAFQPSSASKGPIGDSSTFVAKLSDSAGPVSGATLHFDFQGATHDATTNENGVASSPFAVAGPAATGTAVVVRYDGDDIRTASSDHSSFEVDKRASKISFTARVISHGRVVVSVQLDDRETSHGIRGEAVAIVVNGSRRATVTTDGSGVGRAVLRYPNPRGKTFGVSFAGDDTYAGADARARFGRSGASGSS